MESVAYVGPFTVSILIRQALSSGTTPKQLVRDRRRHKANCRTSGTRYVRVLRSKSVCRHALSQQITLNEAYTLTLRVLKQVMEEKLDQHNVQLAQVLSTLLCFSEVHLHVFVPWQVTAAKGFEILDEVRLKALIDDMAA